MNPASSRELKDRVAEIRWWHTMQLAPGIQTAGAQGQGTTDGTAETLRRVHVPADLTGKTVLDVGAWDGFFSFEAERRGAARVLATDWFSWGGGGWGTQDGFRLAREVLGSKVEDLRIDVMDLSPERVGTFDVVLFLGVLYHLKSPLLGLEAVASVTKDLLILETHVDLSAGEDLPVMVYYPGGELEEDPTSWWGPNRACVEQMVRTSGFGDVRCVSDTAEETITWRRRLAQRVPLLDRLRPRPRVGYRVTIHARKGEGGRG